MKKRPFLHLFLVLLLAGSVSFAFAKSTTWQGANSGTISDMAAGPLGWYNPANWSNGIPAMPDEVIFEGGTYLLGAPLYIEVDKLNLRGGTYFINTPGAEIHLGSQLIIGGKGSASLVNVGVITIGPGLNGFSNSIRIQNGTIDNHTVIYIELNALGAIGPTGTVSNHGDIEIVRVGGNGYGIRVQTLVNTAFLTVNTKGGTGDGILVNAGTTLTNTSAGVMDISAGSNVAIRNEGFYTNNNCPQTNLNGGVVVGPDPCVTFPIDLMRFEGKVLAQSNRLEWETGFEENTAWHIIERSEDGGEFWTEMGRISASGWSGAAKAYFLDDTQPWHNTYYRLRSEDFDGRTSFSDVIQLQRDESEFGVLNARVFPVPATDILYVRFETLRDEPVHFTLTDLAGRVLWNESMTAFTGHHEKALDVSGYPTGMYLLRLGNEQKDQVRKIQIIR
jgi:hypothetical protein